MQSMSLIELSGWYENEIVNLQFRAIGLWTEVFSVAIAEMMAEGSTTHLS